MVNEAVDEDGHQQSRRRLTYEALKNAIDPAPTALRRYEAKGQHAFSQLSAMSVIIATNHRDVVKLPREDRRFCVITGGDRMAIADVEAIRAWMAVPENIGALHRALLAAPAVPLDVFNPFDYPPPFAGRREMIGMGETRLEDAYGTAVDALEGYPLFTLSQVLRLIGYFGGYASGDWTNMARHAVSKSPIGCASATSQQPHHLRQAAGDRLRLHGGGPAALARGGQGGDRRGAQPDGDAGGAHRRHRSRGSGRPRRLDKTDDGDGEA